MSAPEFRRAAKTNEGRLRRGPRRVCVDTDAVGRYASANRQGAAFVFAAVEAEEDSEEEETL